MAGIRRPQRSYNAGHWLINFAAPVWIQDGPDLHRFLILQNAEEVGCIPWPLDLRHVVITREYVSDLQRSRVLNNYLMADNRHHKFSMNRRPPTRTRSVVTQRLREVHPRSLTSKFLLLPLCHVLPPKTYHSTPLLLYPWLPLLSKGSQRKSTTYCQQDIGWHCGRPYDVNAFKWKRQEIDQCYPQEERTKSVFSKSFRGK